LKIKVMSRIKLCITVSCVMFSKQWEKRSKNGITFFDNLDNIT
jgi:hypothetical protein